ncbi:uncharacterized protein LOC123424809 [Hordeum vulgare subsp. vulgare]|uniref:Uncharacterized protein n=1 Tax=Hordeum vulgare subsp. vulgare TaxID=112509 RepID=A0A8I6XD04_HORVV|nr:uncharacterized protein LOC123424809 [Hordeum vulgare subsp. vulgare]
MPLVVVVAMPSAPPPPPPPPPPARIVVVVPALGCFAGFLFAMAEVLSYMGFAGAWIMSAASAAQVVALRAWGDGSAPVLFLHAVIYGALSACICTVLALLALLVLRLCAKCVAYVNAAVSGSTPGFKKSTLRAIRPESAANLFRFLRPAVLGFVVDGAFFLIILAGLLLKVMSPHVQGSISQGEMVGSVIEDVGTFGMHATACFLIIPALFLSGWREC